MHDESLLDLLDGDGVSSEPVGGSSREVFHVPHPAGAETLPASHLLGPAVESPHLGGGESAGTAGLLLLVESGLSASPALAVSPLMLFTEMLRSFSFHLISII